MKASEPQELGPLLKAMLESLGLNKKIRQYSVIDEWPALVGDRIAGVTEPYRVDGGVLYVRVRTAEWRNELSMRKPEILKKINRNGEIIQDILFR